MAIKAMLEIINSRRDTFGNCYWSFRLTMCKTGAQVQGQISGGESNIRAVFNHRAFRRLDWSSIHVTNREVGWREYRRLTNEWEYAGCTPEEIRAFINKGIRKARRAVSA